MQNAYELARRLIIELIAFAGAARSICVDFILCGSRVAKEILCFAYWDRKMADKHKRNTNFMQHSSDICHQQPCKLRQKCTKSTMRSCVSLTLLFNFLREWLIARRENVANHCSSDKNRATKPLFAPRTETMEGNECMQNRNGKHVPIAIYNCSIGNDAWNTYFLKNAHSKNIRDFENNCFKKASKVETNV